MNNFHATAVLVATLCSTGCSKQVPQHDSDDRTVAYIDSQSYRLCCGGRTIANGKETDEFIATTKPKILDLEYSKDATTSDLMHALTYFAGLGIGNYDLIDETRRKHSFFLPGIPDAGVLDGIANRNRMTHPLDEVLSDRPITIKRFSHIMFPAHSVSLTDFARCLQKCAPVGCVLLDGIEDGYLYTGRYEDWMRDNK
jgi:hypothetical protein